MKLPTTTTTHDDSKKSKPLWDTVITSTPVVMTVLATILAGLSSSEMSYAQYYRSLSAQNQSKAGDQWNFFQAKKLRSASALNSLELMQNLGDISPIAADSFSATATRLAMQLDSAHQRAPGAVTDQTMADTKSIQTELSETLGDAKVKSALDILIGGLPPLGDLKISADPKLQHAFDSLAKGQGETTDPAIFAAVSDEAIRDALLQSDQNARTSDDGIKPTTDSLNRLQKLINRLATTGAGARRAIRPATAPATAQPATIGASDRESPGEIRQLAGDFAAAKLSFESARQEREAKLNQQTAYIYEIAVRKTSWDSERHRVRSRYFFYGMLGAQAATTIATLSLAVRERSWMWSVATAIGVIALSYAGYVYLFT